jgi:hypothetical protein
MVPKGGTMANQAAAREALARAVTKAGSVSALAARLKLSKRVLQRYLDGHEPIPDNLFLLAIDVLEGNPLRSN